MQAPAFPSPALVLLITGSVIFILTFSDKEFFQEILLTPLPSTRGALGKSLKISESQTSTCQKMGDDKNCLIYIKMIMDVKVN
jgi:hypothetical protein